MGNTHLSQTQQKIVRFQDGALLVVAGPGSGKTRVLTERIRRLLSDSNSSFRVLALTFTNKAANEMRERLSEFEEINQRAFLGTMHSFCLEVLSTRGKPVGVEGMPNIFERFQDRKQILLDAVLDEPDLREILQESGGPREQDKLIHRWLDMISDAKSRLELPETLRDAVEAKVYDIYDQGLRASSAYDFDDLLLLAYRLFTERPKIADFYRRQYRYIFIDEAQDINEAQYRLLQAICGTEFTNVMMVGDPKQAIFMWNGANPKYLDMFEKDFGAEKLEMTENFRSSQAVVHAASRLIPSYGVEGKVPIPGELITLEAEDEGHEAQLIVDAIQRLHRDGHRDIEGSVGFERMALIGRNRYVFAGVEKQLAEADIPFYKKLSAQHESESDLIQDFELCLRLVANPNDRLHLKTLLKRWGGSSDFGVLRDGGDAIGVLKQAASEPSQKYILDVIEKLILNQESPRLLDALEALSQSANNLNQTEDARALVAKDIQVWRNHWEMFLRSGTGASRHVGTFLSHVALGTTQQPKHDGIALLTVHSAKGLEFDVVFLVGMTEGTFPDYRAKGDALEEETRNAFVAVTRSRRVLYLSYPKQRDFSWGRRSQQPSRFLKTINS